MQSDKKKALDGMEQAAARLDQARQGMEISTQPSVLPGQNAAGNAADPKGMLHKMQHSGQKRQVIRLEDIREATARLNRYKAGKASLEARIVQNEQWWKLRHWETIRQDVAGQHAERLEPASAWLFNSILNKHADAMDNFPTVSVLPREPGDQEDAKELSSILPVVLEENHFEDEYDRMWWYKLKFGSGVLCVAWDAHKENGAGDIDIHTVDLLNLFWEPGIRDIQDSEHLYCVQVVTVDQLKAAWGEKVKDYRGGTDVTVAEYRHDDSRMQDNTATIIDWYYRKTLPDGRTVLHYVKYVGDIILFATENEEDWADRGLYDHGMYPFILDPLFPVEDSPAGFGYIDIMKSPQMYIDRMDAIILRNAMQCGKRRYFVASDGSVNEAEFADWSNDFVHVEGQLDASVKEIEVSGLNAGVYTARQNKIDELKETSGNRDFSQGGTTGGVTAASAVAALQEAGSKLSRDEIKSSYRAYSRMNEMILELIRQFYDQPRTFRITGETGGTDFVRYSNAGIKPGVIRDFGVESSRKPIFDVKVRAQKSSPFSRISQNELAKELMGMGVFNPQMADQSMMLLEMMDFHQYESIDRVRQVVDTLKKEGRPMLNTEWLNRVLDNQVRDNLPLYHDEGIGSYSWGLVAGKSQHFLPWDELRSNRDLPLERWQHDLFDTYHTPYDESELDLMRRLSPRHEGGSI